MIEATLGRGLRVSRKFDNDRKSVQGYCRSELFPAVTHSTFADALQKSSQSSKETSLSKGRTKLVDKSEFLKRKRGNSVRKTHLGVAFWISFSAPGRGCGRRLPYE